MTKEHKITKEMTFGEVLSMYPDTVRTFFMYGMHCFGCHFAMDETIEQGALAHGVDVDKLIEDLNEGLTPSVEAKEAPANEEKTKP